MVECKLWNSRVSKLHVLALCEIVSDIGADRGILLAEKGFQSGASEAAALTNVHLTSLANARQATRNEVFGLRLTELYDRVQQARDRYWQIPKDVRIEHGLRPQVGASGYSGSAAIELAEELLRKGFRGSYPFDIEHLSRYALPGFPETIEAVEELFEHLDPMVGELEDRLDAYTAADEPNPSLR